jgi:hypothetical protein
VIFFFHILGELMFQIRVKEKKDKTLQFIYRRSNSLGKILKENFFVFIFVPQFFFENGFRNVLFLFLSRNFFMRIFFK